MKSLLLLDQSQMVPQEPIAVHLRSSDFDPYGHVNSSKYFDILTSALRIASLKNDGVAVTKAGFSVTAAKIHFRRPIGSVASVTVSFARNERAISFKIYSADGGKVHADGLLVVAGKAPTDRPGKKQGDLPGEPTIYARVMDVRFNDLGSFGQLELNQYLDYVISSRFQFLRQDLGTAPEDLARKGVGFFLTDASVKSFKPVSGMKAVTVRSWVDSINLKTGVFRVLYKIKSQDESITHAVGSFHCVTMDLHSQRPKRIGMPSWANPLFFKVDR